MCNVSVATVSRVINKNGRYSKQTEEKVLKAIEKTGYNININAKSLRSNKTYTIGILIPDITNYFFAELVNKIESLFFDKGFSTIISNTNRKINKERSYLKMMASQGVDGIIVISGDKYFAAEDSVKNTPYICIDRKPSDLDKIPFISSDHKSGGYLAGMHLIESGANSMAILINNSESSANIERVSGFKTALNEANIEFNDNNIISMESLEKNINKGTSPFDGIFAVNDILALKAIKIMENHNIEIPDQVKFIGFDNTPYSELSNPSLTTIKQHTDEIAKTAVKTLINLIEGKETLHPHKQTVPVELIKRESC